MNTPILSTHIPPNFESSPEGVYLKTLYNVGFRLTKISPLISAFIQFSINQKEWVLDVGCGFGIATIPIIIDGGKVIANDLNEQNLDSLKRKIPTESHGRLQFSNAVFPDGIVLADNSLTAILISRFFRFFTNPKLERTLMLCFQWLKPGGKIFIGCNKPELINDTLTNAGFLIERSDPFGIIGQKP